MDSGPPSRSLPPPPPPLVLDTDYKHKYVEPYPTQAIANLHLVEEGTVEASYTLSTLLGTGGFAKVYKAKRVGYDDSQNFFAVKIVKKCRIMDLDASALVKEVEVLRLVQACSFAVSFVDVVETPSRVYLITELLGRPFCSDDGCDVPQFAKEEDVKEILRQMITPLVFLHEHGIVHRDVKPENYLHGQLHLKLIDFGMAEYETKIPDNPLWLGTLHYQAPEMVSQQIYDRKIDIWALGVLAYLLLTRKLPFYDERKNRFIIIEKIKEGSYETAGLMQDSELAREFVNRLLAVDPQQRMSMTDALCHPWLAKV